jgi:hypothetical protein
LRIDRPRIYRREKNGPRRGTAVVVVVVWW